MDQIRPWLYIGKFRDTLYRAYLDSKSIQAILELAEPVNHQGITTLYLPVEDVEPIPFNLLKQGIDFVHKNKLQGRQILIACGAGINRSSAFTAAVLKEEEGLSLFEAFQDVKRKHPDSMPHEPVWESLCKYYNEYIPYLDLLRLKP
jgi:dual specificity protein phosphatase-like protein